MSKKKSNTKLFANYIGHDLINFLSHKHDSLNEMINHNKDLDTTVLKWAKKTQKDCKAAVNIIKRMIEK